jgi:hypothetical protein
MTKFRKLLADLFEEAGVYLFTLLGIVLSQYAPLLLQPGAINVSLGWVRFGISAGMALYLVARDEGEGDKEGRSKNLRKRLAGACAAGYMWNGIVGLAGQAQG